MAIKFKVKTVIVYTKSTLIINKVNGTFIATNPIMTTYLEKIKQLTKKFKKIELKQLLREQNFHVDALANIALSIKINQKRTILIEFLSKEV